MKITERIFDATTGETTDIERDMTIAELAEYTAAQEKLEVIKQQEQAAAERRKAAEAKLALLGLTADDLKALGLG